MVDAAQVGVGVVSGVGGGLGGVLGEVPGTCSGDNAAPGSSVRRAVVTGRTSTCRPNPSTRGRSSSWRGGAVNRTAATVSRTSRARMVAVACRGARPNPSGVRGPSRRIRAWKWTKPRRWYSATLAYCTVTTSCRRVAGMPSLRATARHRVMVNRRHSSGAHHCHTTCDV